MKAKNQLAEVEARTGRKEAAEKLIAEVLKENPRIADEFRAGNQKALGSLVGQAMKKSQGKANPQLVNKILAVLRYKSLNESLKENALSGQSTQRER